MSKKDFKEYCIMFYLSFSHRTNFFRMEVVEIENFIVTVQLTTRLGLLLLISVIKQTQENTTNIKMTSANKHPFQYLVK